MLISNFSVYDNSDMVMGFATLHFIDLHKHNSFWCYLFYTF